ncbi:hypothetical protein FRC03_012752 [Tulasnella sp. 419]|nr:hypothetical protein FRC03_012752 [Tulasnella sp. 419]
MDHSHHHGMGHDHGSMSTESMARCKMHMLWNWETVDTCVVFRSWHVTSTTTFVLSFLAIASISIFFEWLKQVAIAYDKRLAATLTKGKTPLSGTETPGEEALLIARGSAVKGGNYEVPPIPRIIRACLYGAENFTSLFIMLIFMTYNGYLVAAVSLGAAAGHWIFGDTIDAEAITGSYQPFKGGACH